MTVYQRKRQEAGSVVYSINFTTLFIVEHQPISILIWVLEAAHPLDGLSWFGLLVNWRLGFKVNNYLQRHHAKYCTHWHIIQSTCICLLHCHIVLDTHYKFLHLWDIAWKNLNSPKKVFVYTTKQKRHMKLFCYHHRLHWSWCIYSGLKIKILMMSTHKQCVVYHLINNYISTWPTSKQSHVTSSMEDGGCKLFVGPTISEAAFQSSPQLE